MKSSDGWRHMAKVRFAESFVQDFVQDLVDKVSAKSKRDEIRVACSLLEDFPEIGSPVTRPAFVQRYGETVRRLSCRPFVIAYEYHTEVNEVCVLGLMHAREVQ